MSSIVPMANMFGRVGMFERDWDEDVYGRAAEPPPEQWKVLESRAGTEARPYRVFSNWSQS